MAPEHSWRLDSALHFNYFIFYLESFSSRENQFNVSPAIFCPCILVF
jgi:hypothetical protein